MGGFDIGVADCDCDSFESKNIPTFIISLSTKDWTLIRYTVIGQRSAPGTHLAMQKKKHCFCFLFFFVMFEPNYSGQVAYYGNSNRRDNNNNKKKMAWTEQSPW